MTDTTIAPTATARKEMSRWQAAGIHLLISAVIAGIALFVVLRVWYPPPFFTAEGGNELLFLLIAVDVVIGPLLTLIIFKTSKPSLRIDLTIIALFQLAALIYGVFVMFMARPVYVVLVLDQFETVRANDLEPKDLAQARDPAFRSLPVTGPRNVAVDLPKTLKEIKAVIAEAQQSGTVVSLAPKYYVPYAQQRKSAITQSQPLEPTLKRGGDFATLARQFLERSGRKAETLKFIPIQMRRGYGAVLIDANSGDIVTILPPKL